LFPIYPQKGPIWPDFSGLAAPISSIRAILGVYHLQAPPMARGRKSAASLTVIPVVPGQGRPEPPESLDALERRIWRDVVDAMPSHWFDLAGQLVLRRLVAQAAIAERREARLRELRALDRDSGEDAEALAVLHSASAKAVAYLLGQLRATPRSRVVSRAAGPEVEQAPKFRPWEIKARA
jgi:hypothetical protein